jgi:hypothetical protein
MATVEALVEDPRAFRLSDGTSRAADAQFRSTAGLVIDTK